VTTGRRPRRPFPIPRPDRLTDDEMAEAIRAELQLELWALDAIKHRIRWLRGSIKVASELPQPSAAKKTIANIANHATALASAVEKIDPNWRFTLRLQFFERAKNGALIASSDSEQRAEAKMKEWMSQLNLLARDLEYYAHVPHDFLPGPKAKCAWAAADLIRELSPATPLTKGTDSKLHSVASLLWSAVTGEADENMRRACDRLADLFAAIAGTQREYDEKHRE
jgi:hypothetical protein